VATARLDVSYGRNFGVLHDSVTARHVDLVANHNVEAGVWVQSCPSFELSGTASYIRSNGLGGIVAVDTGPMSVTGVEISHTDLLPSVFGETGRVDLGAGLSLVRPQGAVTLRDVTLTRNSQVGLLVQLGPGGTLDAMTIENIRVTGAGIQYGAVVQGGAAPAGWDAGIVRDPVTEMNDDHRSELLDRAGPLEAGNMPAADRIAADGLNAVIDPDPPF
jgi:hypothetical protein